MLPEYGVKIMGELISIIVPIYNTEKYLDQCIASILQQTYDNLEIILVNDGSTDGSGKIAEKYRALDSRIILINQEQGGAANARNNGLKISKGKFIIFVDSDDYIRPDMVQYLLDHILAGHAQIAVCGYSKVDEEGGLLGGCVNFPDIESISGNALWNLYDECRIYFIVLWNKIFQRKFLEDIKFRDGKHFEDEFFFDDIMHKIPRIACAPEIKYYYRQRKNSLMEQRSVIYYPDFVEALIRRLEYLYQLKIYQTANHTFRDAADIFLECCDNVKTIGENSAFSKKVQEQGRRLKRIAAAYIKRPIPVLFRIKVTAFLLGKNVYRSLRDFHRQK